MAKLKRNNHDYMHDISEFIIYRRHDVGCRPSSQDSETGAPNEHEMGIIKRAGVVEGVHNRTPHAARRVGEKEKREYDSLENVT